MSLDPSRPRYTAYEARGGWRFQCWIAESPPYESAMDCAQAAYRAQEADLSEAMDPNQQGIITWLIRSTLKVCPIGQTLADNPFD
jgi:hypothetical protein